MRMERKISHKVGVKLFTKEQFENVLPTYLNLFHKIDACRQAAQEELRELNAGGKRHYQYNFMYDNVFSVLGKRGTGKTSVVFTLQKMIREKYGDKYSDVVLPLIIPEAIPDNCTVLGWILAIVKEEVKRLEDRINELEKRQRKDDFWNQCQYGAGVRKEIGLSDRMDILNQFFYAKSYNPSSEPSYYQAIDNSASQTIDYYRFAQGIADFWDAWVQAICHLRQLEGKKDEVCPLIYFIFDDVDLAPEKIDELLSVIIKYLSHPNIIVLTTADEELFLEVIENRLDQKIGRLPREWRNFLANARDKQDTRFIVWSSTREEPEKKKTEDLISQTTRMYLGKVLPSSTRYYLKLFHTAKQKEAFCLEDGLSLADGVRDQVERLIGTVISVLPAGGGTSAPVNFMKPGNTVINFYLMFMGNTSRQIGNAYIVLQELIDNLITVVEEGKKEDAVRQRALNDTYQNSRYFLSVAIRANHELAEVIEDVDDFVDEVFLPEYNQWKIYTNYAYVNEFLEKNLADENKQRKISMGLQLYSLLSFLENLMLIMEKGIPGGITHRKKIHVVKFLTEYVEREALSERHVFRDDLRPDVFFRHYVNLLDRLPVIAMDEMTQQKFNMEYFYNFTTYYYRPEEVMDELLLMRRNNRKCFIELVGMLSMVFGNAYLIDRQNMENCMVFSEEGCFTDSQISIRASIRQNIINCFGLIKMQEVWKTGKVHFQDAINALPRDNSAFHKRADEVLEQLMEESRAENNGIEAKYVRLSRIVSKVEDMQKDGFGDLLALHPFACCPTEILRDISGSEDSRDNREGRENKDRLSDRKEKENLIAEYARQIREAEHSIGKAGIVYDPEATVEILNNLADRRNVWREQLVRILRELEHKDSTETGEVLVSKKTYYDIIRMLNNAVESGLFEENEYSDNVFTTDNVKEILAKMDVAVYFQDRDDFYTAVRLGFQVLVLEYLQSAYLCQTVFERYEDGINESSRDLEKTILDGQKQETYYFCLFNRMVALVELRGMAEAMGNKSNVREMESMRDEIVAVCSRERQRYVDQLIRGEKR